MTAVRFAACLVVAGSSLVLACSSDVDDADSGPIDARPDGTSSSSGSVSSTSSTGGFGTSASSTGGVDPVIGDRIDISLLSAVTAKKDFCGKPEGSCMDAHSFTVEIQKSSLTATTCVELAGSGADAGGYGGKTTDAQTTRALSAEELAVVMNALTAIRVDANTQPKRADGQPIEILELVTRDGKTHAFAPAACGGVNQSLKEGFDTVFKAITDVAQ